MNCRTNKWTIRDYLTRLWVGRDVRAILFSLFQIFLQNSCKSEVPKLLLCTLVIIFSWKKPFLKPKSGAFNDPERKFWLRLGLNKANPFV